MTVNAATGVLARRRSAVSADAGTRRWPAAPVTLLLVSLVVPVVLWIGPLAVSPYRLVLLALLVPCLSRWTSGQSGPIRAVDILVGLFCLWSALAIAVVHGPTAAIEPGGILFLETFVAYLVARCYIRTRDDMVATARLLFILVSTLLPLALWEAFTRQNLALQIFSAVMPTIADGNDGTRWGLSRVQGPFEHPILFGVFCGGITAITYLVLGQEAGGRRFAMAGAVMLTAMLSMSSGPWVAVLAQVALLAWNGFLGPVAARWRILWVIGAIAYLGLELASDQSVAMILTRYAFDPWTAFYRLLIFEYGWASVVAHPLFGTGFGEWLRPSWMAPSIDMFWLVPAIRHGLPAAILILLAFFTAAATVGFRPHQDKRLVACRTGYLITMAGFFLVGWTVHFWTATYVLFTFLLGSGMWLLDAQSDATAPVPTPTGRRARSRRSRPAAVPAAGAARFSRRAS